VKNYRQALADLERGVLEPLYVLFGEEEFLQDLVLRKLLEVTVDPATRDFNFDLFYGHETDASRVIEAASSYPMMAERRVVVVKSAEKLGPKGIELLGKYAHKPLRSTVLVLLLPKMDQRLKGIKELKSHSVWIECKRLYDRHIPEWIRNYGEMLGLEISPQAGRLLHTLVGNNLRELANELEKVAVNLGDRKRVEEEDVRSVVGFQRSFGPFELNDAVGERDLARSLQILAYLLEVGETPTVIVARLARHFSLLVKVKGMARRRSTKSEISSAVGLHPFFVERYLDQASRFDFDELGRAFEALLDADVALKSSAQPARLALELLLFQICKGIAEPSRYSTQPA
jgi:DNA polymerase-3 subunit delta